MSNFLLGGRLGDLIHQLWVCKNTPGRHDLFITDRRDLHSDGFMLPLDETIEELRPILMQQDYVNSVQAYAGCLTVVNEDKYDLTQNTPAADEIVNLNMWRRFAYSTHWVQLLSNTFGLPVNGEAWIKLRRYNWHFALVHCSVQPARKGNWSSLDLRPGFLPPPLFIGNDEEYKNFGNPMPRHNPVNLFEMFASINNAPLFIGNQSMPLAAAHALGVNRIAVLNPIDAPAYVGEETVYSNFKYIL